MKKLILLLVIGLGLSTSTFGQNDTIRVTVTISDTLLISANIATSSSDVETSDTRFRVFPNPATDVLTIIPRTGDTKYEIYNSVGSVVFSSTSSKEVINVSGWPSGLYMIRIYGNEDLMKTKKLIIK
jgi:hypothetical protein